MIPTVSAEVVNTVILQEGRDVLGYMKESMDLLEERQPVLKKILFHEIEGLLTRAKEGDDDPVVTELKLKAIMSAVIRCIYAQDEVNELAEQWSETDG